MTIVTRRIHFAVKGNRKRAMAGPAPEEDLQNGRTPRVSKLMALAIRFDSILSDGIVASQSEMASLARVTQPRMTQIMNLLHLAPDIQEAILFLPKVSESRDPITEHHLRSTTQIHDWREQRDAWAAMIRQQYAKCP